MNLFDWLLLAVWVGLVAVGWKATVSPGRKLDRVTREVIRRSVPVRHERARDKRSGGRNG